MIIDADAHWAPPAKLFSSLVSKDFQDKYTQANQHRICDFVEYKKSLRGALKVDRQLLNLYGPSLGFQYGLDVDLATALSKSYNTILESTCKENSEFDYTAWLPMQDPDTCCELLSSSAVQNAFAAYIGEQVPWGFMPRYESFFAELARNQIPVYLHFNNHYDFPQNWNKNINPMYNKFFDQYPLPANAGFKGLSPTWKTTLASFILSGWLEKHDLKIILAEQGLTWLLDFKQTMIDICGIDPLPYFQKFFWFTTEPEETNFLINARLVGLDRLLFATDWPHGDTDMGGTNMYHDIDFFSDLLYNKYITQNEYDLVCSQNYLKIKAR